MNCDEGPEEGSDGVTKNEDTRSCFGLKVMGAPPRSTLGALWPFYIKKTELPPGESA